MATTADRLALLLRTKARQRALLEKMYPELDLSTVPFREYGRLFTGRAYVPGFIGGWNAYGRSNGEDAATRDILYDYSGNGRDIKLYNFAFTEGSGWQDNSLVSDGVDDYGKCTEQFALPDDYTVLAVRKILGSNSDRALAMKSRRAGEGAFIFDYTESSTKTSVYSYGLLSAEYTKETLFSYLSKESYNGNAIEAGTGGDTVDDPLYIFSMRGEANRYMQAALYDLRIYDHTLTDSELKTVKDEMMADFVANTGILDGVEYYDILDCRYRSNDEPEETRTLLKGKLGKLNLTLNNFAYSQMSGWNGYVYNWADNGWICDWNVLYDGKVEIGKTYFRVLNTGNQPTYTCFYAVSKALDSGESSLKIKISGLPDGCTVNVSLSSDYSASGLGNGFHEIEFIPEMTRMYFLFKGLTANTDYNITIEQIPVYGGALVSDGVDDFGLSAEAIDEEIGGFVVHAEILNDPDTTGHNPYCFNAHDNADTQSNSGITVYQRLKAKQVVVGLPIYTLPIDNNNIYALSRTPSVPSRNLAIASYRTNGSDYAKMALYQLRLLKSQPTDEQIEVIKWQMLKEHEDYLHEMGWDVDPDEQ